MEYNGSICIIIIKSTINVRRGNDPATGAASADQSKKIIHLYREGAAVKSETKAGDRRQHQEVLPGVADRKIPPQQVLQR